MRDLPLDMACAGGVSLPPPANHIQISEQTPYASLMMSWNCGIEFFREGARGINCRSIIMFWKLLCDAQSIQQTSGFSSCLESIVPFRFKLRAHLSNPGETGVQFNSPLFPIDRMFKCFQGPPNIDYWTNRLRKSLQVPYLNLCHRCRKRCG